MTTLPAIKAGIPVVLFLSLCFAALPAQAGDGHNHNHREAGAHEHGQGVFNMAIEGKSVQMELIAPGADIVGFEHAPKTQDQKAQLASAKATLEKIENVVALPTGAGCTLVKAEADIPGGHDDHGKAAAKGEHEETHSEFHVTYQLECASPGALGAITFSYFDSFKNARELDVTVVTGKGQKAFEVKRTAPDIRLDGLV